MDRVADHFDDEAVFYDDVIEKIIPGYAEQNSVLIDALELAEGPARIADLGIGTGQLAARVLQTRAGAQVVGYDFSQKMLEQAASNLASFAERVDLVAADLGEIELAETAFDAVIAGLSIHHLEDSGKRDLFSKVHRALRPGGRFVIRDVVLGETAEETERFYEEWRAFIRSSGLDDADVLAAHMVEDKPASLGDQMAWLEEAGFADVHVAWQRVNFAVFGGVRPR
jgi:tRNA (cmo5U34)-methyltransferase